MRLEVRAGWFLLGCGLVVYACGGSLSPQGPTTAPTPVPTPNFAVRYYMPSSTTLVVKDATLNWNTEGNNGARFLSRNGAQLPLVSSVGNSGNVDIDAFNVQGQVLNAAGVVQVRKTLASGDVVEASGATPLSVVVGRADVTEVAVRGSPYDLTNVSRDNVARFQVK